VDAFDQGFEEEAAVASSFHRQGFYDRGRRGKVSERRTARNGL